MEINQNIRSYLRNITIDLDNLESSSNYFLTNNMSAESAEDINISQLQNIFRNRMRRRLGK